MMNFPKESISISYHVSHLQEESVSSVQQISHHRADMEGERARLMANTGWTDQFMSKDQGPCELDRVKGWGNTSTVLHHGCM